MSQRGGSGGYGGRGQTVTSNFAHLRTGRDSPTGGSGTAAHSWKTGRGGAGFYSSANAAGYGEGKKVERRTVDYNASCINYMKKRTRMRYERDYGMLQPSIDYSKRLMVPHVFPHNPSHALCTKFVSTSINKNRTPITTISYTPDAKRVVTGTHTGEFTQWNSLTFNFETILQAHDDAIRAAVWSHNDEWMISGDDGGVVKYWQISLNNVQAFKAHEASVRDLSFAPSDAKFVSASDDQTLSIWDFERIQEDRRLTGHGWDVKCVEWHPTKALIVSGSKNNEIRLWDPRTAQCLTTLHGHKSTVGRVRWNANGNWFVSASRDTTLRLWDIRTMRTFQTLNDHTKDVTAVRWHPHFEQLLCSGSLDGSIRFWIVGRDKCQAETCGAHDSYIWDMAWHPVGHMLASASNDHAVRFWTRNRPGDEMADKYNANQLPVQERRQALLGLTEAARLNPTRRYRLPTAYEEFAQAVDEAGDIDEAKADDMFSGMGSASNAAARARAARQKTSSRSASSATSDSKGDSKPASQRLSRFASGNSALYNGQGRTRGRGASPSRHDRHHNSQPKRERSRSPRRFTAHGASHRGPPPSHGNRGPPGPGGYGHGPPSRGPPGPPGGHGDRGDNYGRSYRGGGRGRGRGGGRGGGRDGGRGRDNYRR
jgi:polyadenylation factor subunit 2